MDNLPDYIPSINNSVSGSDARETTSSSFAASLVPSRPDESPDKSVSLEAQVPAQMLFAPINNSFFHLFNFTVRPVVLDTSISCDATLSTPNCHATSQRIGTHRYSSHLRHIMSNLSSEYHRTSLAEEWSLADYYDSSSAAKYLAGTTFSSGNVTAHWPPVWNSIPLEDLSKRMTTLFNTYYDASVGAFSHANVALRRQPNSTEDDHNKWRLQGQRWIPYLNRTDAVSTVRYPIYRAEPLWVATLVIITICLQALAVLGLVLQGLVRGPDILGYASSLTRENPYVKVPPGGSALDGPTRAKVLGRMYVQLADTSPGHDVGHVAFRQVEQEDQEWRQFSSRRLYR